MKAAGVNFTPLSCVTGQEGAGPSLEAGQRLSHPYQHCLLHETDGFVKYSLSKVWPCSILAFHPRCQVMSFLSQPRLCDLSQSLPMNKKDIQEKKDRKTYMILQPFTHNTSWIYTQLEGESERRQAVKKREKNGGSRIHYTLCTCISGYYSYQATNTTVR